jgi:polysaccharide chain length determinant protein (PEP-CTERM system associated)
VIPGKTLEPKDLLNILKRPTVILIPTVLVGAAMAGYVHTLPDLYRSETLIMVVPQRVPDSYVRSTVTTTIQDRLRSFNQQITSRTRLEPVIREFNLYPEQVRSGLMEDVVERMRLDIATEIIRSDAFRISYLYGDARTSMKVTERLASMYIDESLREREVLADSTNQFLDSQLSSAKERLIDHEKKLESYKMRYAGQLPTQITSNLQVMQNAQMQIQSLVDSLNRDRDRQLALQGQLSDLGLSSSDDATSAPRTPPPPSVAAPASYPALQQAQKALEQLQLRLTASHPEVLRQQRVVADLEKKVADETAFNMLAAANAPRQTTGMDPAQLARLSRVEQMRIELESLSKQIVAKEQEEARLRSVIADYQSRVESAPSRESELTELMRDYDTLQRTYTQLLAKKEEAQVSANLERYQIGEQFKILDPARLPEKPYSPDRPRLWAIGVGAGLLIGLLFSAFIEYRDASLKTDADVVATLTLPVLAMIPELVTNEVRQARVRRRRLAWGATAGTAVVAAAAAALWVLRMR